MKRIFISHSSKDAIYVEKVIEIVEAIGVQSGSIFCSSIEGYGITLGENFLEVLKNELNGNVLVIFVISDNFYASPVCLCEMGAAWVKTTQHIPILVPPFSYSDVKGVFPTTQGMLLNEKQKFNNLKNRLESFMEVAPVDLSIWERKRDRIHSEIEALVSKKKDNTAVSFASDSVLNEISTSFFNRRTASSFPGIRGLKWFNDPIEAIDRLSILLQAPLTFRPSNSNEFRSDPIFWFRGNSVNCIERFERLTETKCLIGHDELEIERIGIYHSSLYYKDFVYVEAKADNPTGLYKRTEESIQRAISNSGYAWEEYAEFDGHLVSREEYDDGATVIDGKVVQLSGLRIKCRYITKYNLIIAAADSPYNSRRFESISKKYLDGILWGGLTLEEMIEECSTLRKNEEEHNILRKNESRRK